MKHNVMNGCHDDSDVILGYTVLYCVKTLLLYTVVILCPFNIVYSVLRLVEDS